MGRGVDAHSQAAGLELGRDKGTGGALAIGPPHVDRRKVTLRIAEGG